MTEVSEQPVVLEEEDDYSEPSKPKITARGAALVGVRVVTGLIGTGVAAATIVAATLIPLPTLGTEAPSELVTPVATGQRLLCPGPVLRLADETGQGATTSSPIGRADVTYGASAGAMDSTPLSLSDAQNGGTQSAPALLQTPPSSEADSEPIIVSGAQAQRVGANEFVGLAAAACAIAAGDAWLAGGATTVGRTTLLTLSNPTEVPATVDLELFGENGPIAAPGTTGIVVPPDGQRVLSIAGFAPGLESPVVHVMSRGGQVVANLQQAIVRGLDPGGVDVIGVTAAPSTSLVIPGLVMTDSTAVEQLLAGEGTNDLLTTVRVLVPGEEDATVNVSLVPEDGADTGISFSIDATAGQVTDLPLAEIENGSYTVTIRSSVPVVGAARVSSAGSAGTDFAWLGAATELTSESLLSIATEGSSRVHLANPADAEQTIVLRGSDTEDVTVVVPAGGSAVAKVESGATYRLTGFTQLFAAVSVTQDGFIAGYSAQPAGLASSPIRVFP